MQIQKTKAKHSELKKYWDTYVIMLMASLTVIVPITVYEDLIAVFLLYYIGICIIVPLLDCILLKRMNLRDFINFIGFDNRNVKKSLFIGIGHGLLFFTLTVAGFYIFKDFFMQSTIIENVKAWGVSNESKWILFVIMVLFNGIIEEIFWRGYTYGKLRKYTKKWLTIIIVTLFYTSYHLATVLSFFKLNYLSIQVIFAVFAAGIVWGWMRFKYKNIRASTIGHSFATIGYMTVYLLL